MLLSHHGCVIGVSYQRDVAAVHSWPLAMMRRRRMYAVWSSVDLGTVGLVAPLNISRRTVHLVFVRYTLLAGHRRSTRDPLYSASRDGPAWIPPL